MKCCICAIAKNENNYIKEWVDYHLNLKFDHIFLYDNNDINGEKISDKINNENVSIIDYRGRKYAQPDAYTNCFNVNKSLYDWFLFIDIDEFLVLEKTNDIHDFLNDSIFENSNIIRLYWKHFDDNDLIKVENDNYNVINRFTREIIHRHNCAGKSFINKNFVFTVKNKVTAHGVCDNSHAVNALGKECKNGEYLISYDNHPIYKNAWINHYPTKTIEEYIKQKYFRGDVSTPKFNNKYCNLEHFFDYNIRTKEKEDYANELIEKIKTFNL